VNTLSRVGGDICGENKTLCRVEGDTIKEYKVIYT
jgi:hypothetical protein